MTKLFPGKKDQGIAIIMVMTSIAILSIILASFTYDTELNKIKVYNRQDKLIAKLNAESGLHFAIAKLKLYREAHKALQQNESIKNVLPENVVQSIITQPFVYPPPSLEGANIMEKNAIKEFMESALIEGGMSITISPISGFLNPNNLRLPELKKDDEATANTDKDSEDTSTNSKESEVHTQVEKELLKMLTEAIKNKKESDEEFNIIYSDIEPIKLVKELKFFVNDYKKYEDDYTPDLENIYSQKEMTPKHGPLTSTSELYLLAGWDDAIVDLIKDRLTVYEVGIIPINELTENQLKIIFPEITDEQSTEFFHYRDGNPEASAEDEDEDSSPNPFKSESEFKTVVTKKLNIIDEGGYDDRMKELKKAGLKLGVSGKLFKVVSRGSMNNSVYTLTAIVDMPVKEQEAAQSDTSKSNQGDSSKEESDSSKTTTTTTSDDKETPTELLAPRIIDLIIN